MATSFLYRLRATSCMEGAPQQQCSVMSSHRVTSPHNFLFPLSYSFLLSRSMPHTYHHIFLSLRFVNDSTRASSQADYGPGVINPSPPLLSAYICQLLQFSLCERLVTRTGIESGSTSVSVSLTLAVSGGNRIAGFFIPPPPRGLEILFNIRLFLAEKPADHPRPIDLDLSR